MNREKMKKMKIILQDFPEIKMVYLFGSRASGKTSPMSDFDFAVYFDGKDAHKMQKDVFKLRDKISQEFKTDNIDIVILNTARNSELKYRIIQDGKLIFEREPFKVLVEPKILNEYFEYQSMLVRHKLSKPT